eukprot:TRINITY_DN1417_c0_g1_i1.p1 TRINITY_DN1417_c0_g1~~TRINITY_DN1417_c0_g1_i1.p1  ORF type:complete len:203 (-),score=22.31 TRINITY_DN1417_c0_g1_i1:104-712(-)
MSFRLLFQRIIHTSYFIPRCHAFRFYHQKASPTLRSSPFICAGILSYLKSTLNIEDPSSPDDKLVDTIKLGILNIQREEYEKAELILHAALRMANDLNHLNGVIYIHDLMADLAYQKGDFIKAERLFTDVLKRLLSPPKNVGLHDNSVVEVSLKLAQIYDHQGLDGKAREGFAFCVRTLDNKVARDQNGEGKFKFRSIHRVN